MYFLCVSCKWGHVGLLISCKWFGIVIIVCMYPYKVAVIFSNFNQHWNWWHISVKVSNLNSTNICVMGTKLIHVDRQTDGSMCAMKLIVFCFPSALRTCQTVEWAGTHTDYYTCLSNNAVHSCNWKLFVITEGWNLKKLESMNSFRSMRIVSSLLERGKRMIICTSNWNYAEQAWTNIQKWIMKLPRTCCGIFFLTFYWYVIILFIVSLQVQVIESKFFVDWCLSGQCKNGDSVKDFPL
jgi:hypothetical protein